jgi:chorismate mutase
VDRIDLAILKLLQQRTRLSRLIGKAKRRHGAVIYVPARERELLRRVERLSRGKLPPRAVTAIYREILSSSRAAQGQEAIGLLRSGSAAVISAARDTIGSCSEFLPRKSWSELDRALKDGSISLALFTGDQLGHILDRPASRRGFLLRHRVAGDFTGPTERIHLVIRRPKKPLADVNRPLILIECKSTADAVKNWIKSMPKRSIELGPRGGSSFLVSLRVPPSRKMDDLLAPLQNAGIRFSVIGGSEDYAG